MSAVDKLVDITRFLDSRTLVIIGIDRGKHSGATPATVAKVLETLKEVIAELSGAPALDGATNTPLEGVMLNSAGEFAARWNVMEPAERERVWKAIQDACNDGYQCHVKDHTTLEREWEELLHKRNTALSELSGLQDSLDEHITHDEIYSMLQTIKEAL